MIMTSDSHLTQRRGTTWSYTPWRHNEQSTENPSSPTLNLGAEKVISSPKLDAMSRLNRARILPCESVDFGRATPIFSTIVEMEHSSHLSNRDSSELSGATGHTCGAAQQIAWRVFQTDLSETKSTNTSSSH